MTFNFDTIVNRRKTNSCKWNVKENELPLWIADMDFDTAPEIKEALLNRISVGALGYAETNSEWENAYISWWKRRYNFEIQSDWLIFSTGVVPSISSTVRKLTTPGENVLILTPTYNIFFNSIVNNGRNPLECQLEYDGTKYEIDFEDLELKLSNKQTSLMILCNPQNPVGKIWSKDELAKIGELCYKYNVIVFSDEIHCDITEPGKNYIPFASVNEICKNNCIMACAPTKSFNIAGLSTSAMIVPNENLRHKVWRQINTDECGEPNALAVQATIAAYNNSEDWFEEARNYIWKNRETVCNYIEENIKNLSVIKSDATYLMWIDVSKSGLSGDEFATLLREKTGLFLSGGSQYGKGGEYFVRLNLATSREIIMEALHRLEIFVNNLTA